ncbi:MAG TPA: hypothetical protein VIO64_12895 [Pseudobacteroides sp.]|uniref:hypothetical protein n=1 Tax=Pseudobacteroides sp. TaxID=1968840 RepID=UPI002F9422CD
MKIGNSSISMSSTHSVVQAYTKEESLNIRLGSQNIANSQNLSPNSLKNSPGVTVDLSKEGAEASVNGANGQLELDSDLSFALSEKDKQKIELVETMFEILLGKKIKLKIPEAANLKKPDQKISIHPSLISPRKNLEMEYKMNEAYSEQEKMEFKSSGTIKTLDGKEINFQVSLSMSREFSQSRSINMRAVETRKVDPLVINYSGTTPNLTDRKFSFDIDSDGKSDQISFLSRGSGFLAFDQNNDGIINNGRELFGPQSGDGFKDLSMYDADNNNWIDENDPIFDKLRIWTKDENGKDTLFALGEKGIGAIYLGNISTQFNFKNAEGTSNGQLQKTGIFVKEDNTVGTIQHIDLSI